MWLVFEFLLVLYIHLSHKNKGTDVTKDGRRVCTSFHCTSVMPNDLPTCRSDQRLCSSDRAAAGRLFSYSVCWFSNVLFKFSFVLFKLSAISFKVLIKWRWDFKCVLVANRRDGVFATDASLQLLVLIITDTHTYTHTRSPLLRPPSILLLACIKSSNQELAADKRPFTQVRSRKMGPLQEMQSAA